MPSGGPALKMAASTVSTCDVAERPPQMSRGPIITWNALFQSHTHTNASGPTHANTPTPRQGRPTMALRVARADIKRQSVLEAVRQRTRRWTTEVRSALAWTTSARGRRARLCFTPSHGVARRAPSRRGQIRGRGQRRGVSRWPRRAARAGHPTLARRWRRARAATDGFADDSRTKLRRAGARRGAYARGRWYSWTEVSALGRVCGRC